MMTSHRSMRIFSQLQQVRLILAEFSSFLTSIIIAEEYAAVFTMLHACTNTISAKVSYQVGLGEGAPIINKAMLVARTATMQQMIDELAYLPKLMTGAVVQESHNTILFSLLDNRKSEGRRYDSISSFYPIPRLKLTYIFHPFSGSSMLQNASFG